MDMLLYGGRDTLLLKQPAPHEVYQSYSYEDDNKNTVLHGLVPTWQDTPVSRKKNGVLEAIMHAHRRLSFLVSSPRTVGATCICF